jgi:hypothetical protein
MAFRKATITEQFRIAIQDVLEPGERVETGTLAQSGPTPWLVGAVGIVMMLVLGMRYYFIAVTDRRVLFMRASLMTGRPSGLAWADRRGAGRVFEVDADAALWSHFKYERPGDREVTRFNVHRIWRDELRHVLSAMTTLTSGALPAPPPSVPA